MRHASENRFWEIDLLRGVAVVLMVVFHFLFDLDFFGAVSLDFGSGFLWWLGRATAGAFIFLVGVSLTVSFGRAQTRLSGRQLPVKFVKRGLMVFSWGIVITIITRVFLGEGVIFFGVLHFIGLSIILAYPLIRYRILNLVLAAAVAVLGVFVRETVVDSYWLLWLGFNPPGLYTLDYFPILPWFSVILLGLFFGNTFYPNARRGFRMFDVPKHGLIRLTRFLGERSLLVYLVHQPILVVLLYSAGVADAGLLAPVF